MGLTVTELLPDYQASLNDAAGVFGDGASSPTLTENLTRHLQIAARALSADGKRPLIKLAALTLVAGVNRYAGVPADLIVPRAPLWNAGADLNGNALEVWEQPNRAPPAMYLVATDTGLMLQLLPTPVTAQIAVYGATFEYTYLAAHALTDADGTSTLPADARNLVILRAQVEAMREMTFRNIHKPTTLRAAGGGASASNMQPSALYERLLAEYQAAA